MNDKLTSSTVQLNFRHDWAQILDKRNTFHKMKEKQYIFRTNRFSVVRPFYGDAVPVISTLNPKSYIANMFCICPINQMYHFVVV